MTKIYQAGSIDYAEDDGRGWRNDLESTYPDIEWLNPLAEHDPRDGDYSRDEIVPDDLRLLDEADGVLLKYEHGRQCWGTPSEQGYTLAINRHTERSLPLAVWWDEMGQTWESPTTVFEEYTIENASPWLTDENCCIGVYSDREKAIGRLTTEIEDCHSVQTVWDRGDEERATNALMDGIHEGTKGTYREMFHD